MAETHSCVNVPGAGRRGISGLAPARPGMRGCVCGRSLFLRPVNEVIGLGLSRVLITSIVQTHSITNSVEANYHSKTAGAKLHTFGSVASEQSKREFARVIMMQGISLQRVRWSLCNGLCGYVRVSVRSVLFKLGARRGARRPRAWRNLSCQARQLQVPLYRQYGHGHVIQRPKL
ncbi:hypothetical protein BD779DRAFT_678145 [Infundibulicybe gibba]|nr:hypothetical protein BD779DRAFT_678145 [Infundibulicybe gibba]